MASAGPLGALISYTIVGELVQDRLIKNSSNNNNKKETSEKKKTDLAFNLRLPPLYFFWLHPK